VAGLVALGALALVAIVLLALMLAEGGPDDYHPGRDEAEAEAHTRPSGNVTVLGKDPSGGAAPGVGASGGGTPDGTS
jgi:hypothetical protein